MAFSQKGSAWVIIISFFFIVSVVGFLIYSIFNPYLFQGGNKTETGKLLDDWKTFQNASYGFEFLYPPDWKPSGRPMTDESGSIINSDGTVELKVLVYPEKKYSSLEDFLNYLDESRATNYLGGPSVVILEELPFKVRGLEGVHRKVFLSAAGFPAIETLIFEKKLVVSLTSYLFRNSGKMPEDKYFSDHQEIFETFKFFESVF